MPDNSACTPLQDRLTDASSEFNVGQQHLSLSVPQIYVGRMARGYVSPDLWEEGINAGLLNYSFNGNSINNRSNHNAGKSNYAYLNLQSGINIGITQRGVITVGVAIHLTAINGSISIRRLNVTLFRYAHG